VQTLSRTNVVPLDSYRRISVSRDDTVNAEWDSLLDLVEEAWTWRDPEALAGLAACVTRLRLRSREEWKR
jgi:hypothetical protein